MVDLFIVPLAVMAVGVWLAGVSFWTVSVFFAGVWYGARRYADGAELDGRRFWPCSRRLWLGRCLRWVYGYQRVGRAPASRQTPVIYAVHPHGMVTAATVLTFLVDGGDSPAIMTHEYMLSVPLVPRELALWLGCVAQGRATARRVLREQGRSLVLVPGGKHELDRMGDPAKTHAWLLERVFPASSDWHAPLVPVWAPDEFNVTWTWRCPWPWPLSVVVQALGRRLKWPVLQWLFIWPRCGQRRRFRVYVGRPIVPADYPTLAAFAGAYLEELNRLKGLSGRSV
jgi:hypothetical protein